MSWIIGLTTFLFGVIWIKSIFPRIHELEKISLGFLLSTGVFSLLLFLANIGGYILNLTTGSVILVILLLLSCFSLAFSRGLRKNFFMWTFFAGKLKKVILICGLVIIALFISSLIYNIYWPVNGWDALTLYDFRGRFFAETGNIREVFSIHRYYLGYPLYTSLMHSWIYILGLSNPSFFYSLLYIAFILTFYFNLARLTNSRYAIVFSTLLAFYFELFQNSLIAYTNLPYTVFIVLGFLYLLTWCETEEKKYLFLSALLVGISGWIRSSDPFWVVPLVITFYYLVKSGNFVLWLGYVLIVVLFRLPWSIFVNVVSKGYIVTTSNQFGNFLNYGFDGLISRFIKVVNYFFINVFKPNWAILMVFLAGLLIVFRSKNKLLKYLGSMIFLSLGIIFSGIYFYSLVYEKWQLVGNSVARMSMFLPPLIIFFAAVLLYQHLTNPKGI